MAENSVIPLFPDLPTQEPDNLQRLRRALSGMDRVFQGWDDSEDIVGDMERIVLRHLTGSLLPLRDRYAEITREWIESGLDLGEDMPEFTFEKELRDYLHKMESARIAEVAR